MQPSVVGCIADQHSPSCRHCQSGKGTIRRRNWESSESTRMRSVAVTRLGKALRCLAHAARARSRASCGRGKWRFENTPAFIYDCVHAQACAPCPRSYGLASRPFATMSSSCLCSRRMFSAQVPLSIASPRSTVGITPASFSFSRSSSRAV